MASSSGDEFEGKPDTAQPPAWRSWLRAAIVPFILLGLGYWHGPSATESGPAAQQPAADRKLASAPDSP